jgi:hypothetical protein
MIENLLCCFTDPDSDQHDNKDLKLNNELSRSHPHRQRQLQRQRIDKRSIGLPTDFKHCNHMGPSVVAETIDLATAQQLHNPNIIIQKQNKQLINSRNEYNNGTIKTIGIESVLTNI